MNKLFVLLSISCIVASTFGQIAGGSASFGNRGQSGAEQARAAELAKRNIQTNDGRYVDAAILMNVEADEYIAVFSISQEGKTIEEAQRKVDSAVRSFSTSLSNLKVPQSDYHVDFIAQNRIYGYDTSDPSLLKEVVVGFEVKKNFAIRFKDKNLLDQLTIQASKVGIFDLVKVDYIIKDFGPVRKKLMEEAGKIIRAKIEDQEALLGMKVGQLTVAVPGSMSTYYPVEMYESYIAQESEEMLGYRQNVNVQRVRKPRTFYYNPLSPKDFDSVINPSQVEPCVQATIYVRLKY